MALNGCSLKECVWWDSSVDGDEEGCNPRVVEAATGETKLRSNDRSCPGFRSLGEDNEFDDIPLERKALV